MLRMATSPRAVLANLKKFEEEVEASPDLQEHLAYFRAWYAHRQEDGSWIFGPSKFVGYVDISSKRYLEAIREDEIDGRRTEAQLQQWFGEIGPDAPEFDELNAKLSAYLAKYGKAPSRKARINVLKDQPSKISVELPGSRDELLVELLLAVAKTLPDRQLGEVRRRLAA